MSVKIEARRGYWLQLSGDIETILDLPARGIAEGFSLAFSDGTLLRGTYLADDDICRFAIMTKGAARAKITQHEAGDVADLGWNFDWITLACGRDTLQPDAAADTDDVLQLTLDIEVEKAA